ncbi:hypothetical protein Misp01_56400 [Microtetraspora sp. NBRC 13810]|nr:hypothetical protein Misp01_56400 [Microtetraspora sp. NBRC 13810]
MLGVLCVLAAVAGGLGYLVSGDLRAAQAVTDDRRAAVRAASGHAVNLLSVSHESVDTDIGRLLDTSTGAARAGYVRDAPGLKETTVRDKVMQTGVLRAAGLVSLRGNSARVLVVADVVIRWEDSETPAQERFHRWRMDLARVGGVWLVSQAEQVP